MEKKQKIWFSISLAVFLIPEVLWGILFGVTNFNKKFLFDSDNHQILTLVSFIETMGLLFSTIFIFKLKSNWLLNLLKVICIAATLWGLYITYLLYATMHFWR